MPRWAFVLTWVFGILSSLCWISLAIFALLFQSMVIETGEKGVIPILAILAIVPVLAALILDYSYARSLAGYGIQRGPAELRVRAAVAAILVLVLGFVNPFLPLGIIFGGFTVFALIRLYWTLVDRDRLWDFNPEEAASIFSGRDRLGFKMAQDTPATSPSFLRSLRNVASAIGFLVTLVIGSWLAASNVLTSSAVFAAVLLSLWATESIGAFLSMLQFDKPPSYSRSGNVIQVELEDDPARDEHKGLWVQDLSVSTASGQKLLRDVNLEVPPGTLVGVIGDAASGKSLLLSSLISPYDLCALTVEGHVQFNEGNLWSRSADPQFIPAVYLPKEPILLPTSGLKNLTCFQDARVKERARKIMEQMLYSGEAADRILEANDATLLSASEQKALGFARAFLLNPGLYLIDQPEVSSSEAMIAALCQRFQIERRSGRSFVVVTDNRAIHEMADFLLVMSDGRVIDYGPSDDVRARMSSGWARLVVDRSLDSEEAVQNWIRSHFRRDGDEKNRRNVSIVASELLALSCQENVAYGDGRASFDFKHQKEHCILRIKDRGELLTSGQMAKADARKDAKIAESGTPTALGRILRDTLTFDQSLVDGERTISLTIRTYDPRLTKRDQVNENAR